MKPLVRPANLNPSRVDPSSFRLTSFDVCKPRERVQLSLEQVFKASASRKENGHRCNTKSNMSGTSGNTFTHVSGQQPLI